MRETVFLNGKLSLSEYAWHIYYRSDAGELTKTATTINTVTVGYTSDPPPVGPVGYSSNLLRSALLDKDLPRHPFNNSLRYMSIGQASVVALCRSSLSSFSRRSFYVSRQTRKILYKKHAKCWTFKECVGSIEFWILEQYRG